MKILRPAQTAEKLGMAVVTVWRKAKEEPDFPKPVKMSPTISGFLESEVDAYIESKVKASRERPGGENSSTARATAASALARKSRRISQAANGVSQ